MGTDIQGLTYFKTYAIHFTMSHGSYRMDEWTLPLRVVKYSANLDVDGNRSFEICDAKNRTCFFVRINGREFGAADSLEKDIIPKILETFNWKLDAAMASKQPYIKKAS